MLIYFRGSMVPMKYFNMNIFQHKHLLPLYCFKIKYWAVSSAGFAQGVKAPNGTITYSKLN